MSLVLKRSLSSSMPYLSKLLTKETKGMASTYLERCVVRLFWSPPMIEPSMLVPITIKKTSAYVLAIKVTATIIRNATSGQFQCGTRILISFFSLLLKKVFLFSKNNHHKNWIDIPGGIHFFSAHKFWTPCYRITIKTYSDRQDKTSVQSFRICFYLCSFTVPVDIPFLPSFTKNDVI